MSRGQEFCVAHGWHPGTRPVKALRFCGAPSRLSPVRLSQAALWAPERCFPALLWWSTDSPLWSWPRLLGGL